ncbi:MAG: zf-HC2 domain-containing protein, partial [Gemmatimonadales bacterium]
MDERPMTCELVDQNELDRRYLEGRLSEEEAAAFEAHYFGCDRCWELVKGGAAVRAALDHDTRVPAPRERAWWKPLAIAAGLAIVAFGT